MQREALKVAQNYEKEAKERLRRISLIAAGLDVIGGRKANFNISSAPDTDETWYDEASNGQHQGNGETQFV